MTAATSPTVTVGTSVPPWDVPEVSREKMKTMAALLADSNPIHFDLDAVRELGMGERPINQGPNNLAYVMNMLSAWAGGPQHVRRVAVRFLGNVLGDDHVVASGVVTAVRTEGQVTLAECDVRLDVVGEVPQLALQGTATVDVSGLAG